MVSETPTRLTNQSGNGSKEAASMMAREKNSENAEIFISPGFKSAAAKAGWDEEDLIIASFVVEDTPEISSSKRRRRSNLLFKTPPSSGSRRKQRVKHSPVPLPVVDLEQVIRNEEENNKEKKLETKTERQEEKRRGKDEDEKMIPTAQSSNSVVLPCIDKLRDELSCAICLEICFEPSTTTCGHSFCKKCLRSAADKCGRKCPKCRQLIGNGRYCTVNTVLWNTIQLLFPKEVEAQRAASDSSRGKETMSPRNPSHQRLRSRNSRENQERLQREDLSRLIVSEERNASRRRRGGGAAAAASMRLNQNRDAALALQLQRQEFASAFGSVAAAAARIPATTSSNLSLARANLRAMASRAVQRRQG